MSINAELLRAWQDFLTSNAAQVDQLEAEYRILRRKACSTPVSLSEGLNLRRLTVSEVPGVSATLLTYLLTLMALRGGNGTEAYTVLCQTLKAPMSEAAKNMVCVYLLTRANNLVKWLISAAEFALRAVEQDRWLQPIAERIMSGLWMFISHIMVNSYSVDTRMLLCENTALCQAFARAVLLFSMQVDPDQEAEAQVGLIIDALGASPFWSNAMHNMELRTALFGKLIQLFDYPQSKSGSKSTMETSLLGFHAMMSLILTSETFIQYLGSNETYIEKFLALIFQIVESPDCEWAHRNIIWLKHSEALSPSEQARSIFLEDEEAAPVNFTIMTAGQCLMALHVIARTDIGAATLKSEGPRTLRNIRRLIDLHGDEMLQKLGLWPMVLNLVPVCAFGEPTNSADAPPLKVRTWKHYSVLLRCNYCSRISIGSRQLKICGECHLVRYCGRECQQQDWQKTHQALCGHFSPGN